MTQTLRETVEKYENIDMSHERTDIVIHLITDDFIMSQKISQYLEENVDDLFLKNV